jgi:small subunit ribosomal protein S4
MTKVLKAKFKVSRRLGCSIWGDEKDPVHKKNYKPGQHSDSRRSNSDYGSHLISKQKLKVHYGRIGEKQFRNTFKLAAKKTGNTGENFIVLLESRLDVAVYRMGFAPSIFAARQFVSHGHILVNSKRVNIPSYKLKIDEVICLNEKARNLSVVNESIQKRQRSCPSYYSVSEGNTHEGKLVRSPSISDVPYPFEINVQAVIEYYSR